MVALITDVHYRMSPALIRALAKADVKVYTCEKKTYTSLPGARSKFTQKHYPLPEEGYADALYRLAEDLGMQHDCKPALLPIGAATLQLLSREAERFSRVAGLCIASPETLDLLNSKKELHRLARELGITVPEEYTIDSIPLPCVVKPTCGEKLGLTADERYRICRTDGDLMDAYAYFKALSGEPPVVQEYLSGGGLGCSVLAKKGRILAYIGHRRIREYPISGGPSSCCVSLQFPTAEVEKIVSATEFSGLAMFEFKEGADGIPRLLECNPRIWGSFPLTEAADSTLPFTWFAAAWNNGNPKKTVPLPLNRFRTEQKMCFFPSDLLAGIGYLKNRKPALFFKALGNLFDPTVRDGIFRWKDPSPAFAYYASLLKRGGKKE